MTHRKSTHLDRTGIYYTLLVLQSLRNGIFGNDCFTSTGVGRDEYAFVSLDSIYRDLLEGIEFEGIYTGGFGGRYMLRYRSVVISWRYGDLMSDLQVRSFHVSLLRS